MVKFLPADCFLEFVLVHLRPAFDAATLGLGVELTVRASAGAAVRAQTAAPARRDVVDRRAARFRRLAVLRPFLVHGSRFDLFGGVLGLASFLEPGLDVLVLTFTFRTPRVGHRLPPCAVQAPPPDPPLPPSSSSRTPAQDQKAARLDADDVAGL